MKNEDKDTAETTREDEMTPCKEPYEKPQLRTIELAAYDVLGSCANPDATDVTCSG